MIWWLVDHASVIYLLLGLALLVAGVLFWQTKRGRELMLMGILLAIGLLFWILCTQVVTDRKQVEGNMRALADAALDARPEKMPPLLAKDFRFQNRTRSDVGDLTQAVKEAGVSNYNISSFEVEKISKDGGRAEVSFRLRVDHRGGTGLFLCRGVFVFEEGNWKLLTFKVYNPLVNSDQPIFE